MHAAQPFAPGTQLTLQRRWLLSLATLVVLLQGAIFAVVDPDLAGWHPYHGHVTLGGDVADHTHPWDAGHNHGVYHVFGASEAGEQEVGFTGSDDLGSVAGLILPGMLLTVAALAAALMARRASGARAPAPAPTDVPVPPPRS